MFSIFTSLLMYSFCSFGITFICSGLILIWLQYHSWKLTQGKVSYNKFLLNKICWLVDHGTFSRLLRKRCESCQQVLHCSVPKFAYGVGHRVLIAFHHAF